MSIVTDISKLKVKSTDVVSVEEATSVINKLERELLRYKKTGVGLSAIQIGISKRISIIRCRGRSVDLINASIIDKSGEIVFLQEGCLSFPNKFINTTRYTDFVIKNHVIDGDKFREETQFFHYDVDQEYGDGLLSIAVQHEIDHLDGKVFTEVESVDVHFNDPIRRSENKAGRNEPCPCGSGKKFKKCCISCIN